MFPSKKCNMFNLEISSQLKLKNKSSSDIHKDNSQTSRKILQKMNFNKNRHLISLKILVFS